MTRWTALLLLLLLLRPAAFGASRSCLRAGIAGCLFAYWPDLSERTSIKTLWRVFGGARAEHTTQVQWIARSLARRHASQARVERGQAPSIDLPLGNGLDTTRRLSFSLCLRRTRAGARADNQGSHRSNRYLERRRLVEGRLRGVWVWFDSAVSSHRPRSRRRAWTNPPGPSSQKLSGTMAFGDGQGLLTSGLHRNQLDEATLSH